MNPVDILLVGIVLGLTGNGLRVFFKRHKSKKNGCSGNCSGCSCCCR